MFFKYGEEVTFLYILLNMYLYSRRQFFCLKQATCSIFIISLSDTKSPSNYGALTSINKNPFHTYCWRRESVREKAREDYTFLLWHSHRDLWPLEGRVRSASNIFNSIAASRSFCVSLQNMIQEWISRHHVVTARRGKCGGRILLTLNLIILFN